MFLELVYNPFLVGHVDSGGDARTMVVRLIAVSSEGENWWFAYPGVGRRREGR